jgi:hypothetical protein
VTYAVTLARTRRFTTPLGVASLHQVRPTFFFGFEDRGERGRLATRTSSTWRPPAPIGLAPCRKSSGRSDSAPAGARDMVRQIESAGVSEHRSHASEGPQPVSRVLFGTVRRARDDGRRATGGSKGVVLDRHDDDTPAVAANIPEFLHAATAHRNRTLSRTGTWKGDEEVQGLADLKLPAEGE